MKRGKDGWREVNRETKKGYPGWRVEKRETDKKIKRSEIKDNKIPYDENN